MLASIPALSKVHEELQVQSHTKISEDSMQGTDLIPKSAAPEPYNLTHQKMHDTTIHRFSDWQRLPLAFDSRQVFDKQMPIPVKKMSNYAHAWPTTNGSDELFKEIPDQEKQRSISGLFLLQPQSDSKFTAQYTSLKSVEKSNEVSGPAQESALSHGASSYKYQFPKDELHMDIPEQAKKQTLREYIPVHSIKDPWRRLTSRLPSRVRYYHGGFQVRELQSLELLKRNMWLDGDIIQNTLQCLPCPAGTFIGDEAQYGSAIHPLTCEEVHRDILQNMRAIPADTERMLLPILLEQDDHWVTVVVGLLSNQITVELANSLESIGANLHDQILAFVKQYYTLACPRGEEMKGRWPLKLTEVSVPQQDGIDDCGVHTIHTICTQLLYGRWPQPEDCGVHFCDGKREHYTRLVVNTYLDKYAHGVGQSSSTNHV